MKRAGLLLWALVLILALTSCGDDSVLTTGASTTTEETTTTAEATTTTETTIAEATTTTEAVTTTTQATTTAVATLYVIDPNRVPDVFGASGDPNGSGCAPPGDVLPDGVWFGFAKAVGGGVITFDLACFFTGAAADAAANADYGGTDGAEDGFHIRNKNPKVFAVTISPTAEAYYVPAAGPTWFPQSIPLASWPRADSWLPCPSEYCAVWLALNGGLATQIVEQYLP